MSSMPNMDQFVLEQLSEDKPLVSNELVTFEAGFSEIQQKLKPLLERVKNSDLPTSKGLSYLDVKNHLLLNYCINLCFFMLLKLEGKQVSGHPVIYQLIQDRSVLTKLLALDKKLKYQIHKLLKMAAFGQTSSDPNLEHRPNMKDFESSSTLEEVYRPPKFAEVTFSTDREKREEKIEKEIIKSRQSNMSKLLMEEFSELPAEVDTSGLGLQIRDIKEIMEEKEIEKYEDEHFMPVARSKQRKKQDPLLIDPFKGLAKMRDLTSLNLGRDELENEDLAKNRSLDQILESIDKQDDFYKIKKNKNIENLKAYDEEIPSDDDEEIPSGDEEIVMGDPNEDHNEDQNEDQEFSTPNYGDFNQKETGNDRRDRGGRGRGGRGRGGKGSRGKERGGRGRGRGRGRGTVRGSGSRGRGIKRSRDNDSNGNFEKRKGFNKRFKK